MTMVLLMLRQIAIMALLVLVGIYLSRRGFLSEQGTRDLGAILIRVIIPVVIVKSFITPFSAQRLQQLGLSFLLALLSYVLAMAVSWLVFGKRRRIENFAASFCNAGFIGIPLAQAVIGEDGVFFIASSIALLNLFQWTWGVYIMTDNRDAISVKTIVKNPVVIAITPVAMILLGTYMARLPMRRILLEKRAYLCVVLRLLAIPALTLLVFRLLPVGDRGVLLTVFLAAATPVGANICVFAQQNNCDYELSVVTVCLSTLLSAVTVPLLVSAAQAFL